jgi:acyl-CoA thioesterase I
MVETRRTHTKARPVPMGAKPGASAGSSSSRNRWLAIGAVALVVLSWLLLRPSPYARVTNLQSRGTAIIAFGDSLTAGYGAVAGEDYPSRLSAICNVPVLNAGKSGDTTQSALTRLESDVLSHAPRIVLIGLGGNDFLGGVSLPSTEENLRTIIRKAQSAGAMVILLGFKFPSLNANYEAMYKRVGREEGCLLVPGTLAGILTDPALRSDAIHPNARGYDLMAQRLSTPLRKLLDQANSHRAKL